MEDIFCFERELPPAPPRPIRGRVCVELDGVAGMECWPDAPASVPQMTPAWSVCSFTASSIPGLIPPKWSEISLLLQESSPQDGHPRLLEEPPRA
jgi:hypothetical protein